MPDDFSDVFEGLLQEATHRITAGELPLTTVRQRMRPGDLPGLPAGAGITRAGSGVLIWGVDVWGATDKTWGED